MKTKLAIILIVLTMLGSVTVLGGEESAYLVLFRGDVQLQDHNGKKAPVHVGQMVYEVQYPLIVLGSPAAVFLKRGTHLVQLNKPGEYLISSLFVPDSPEMTDAISFLKQVTQPRSYSSANLARGEDAGVNLDDAVYFESLWERIVLESEEQVSEMQEEDLLAAAAWFQQQGRKARVAFILERLNSLKSGENEFYRQLRLESLRGIRLVEINHELESTRQVIAAKSITLRYKALLIGINHYLHPAWQELKNPVSDIRAIGQVLLDHYHFNPADITLLENASYDDIIEAFNQLKQTTDEHTSLLVYYAGHGYYPRDEGEGYWIPRDAGEPESLRLFLPTSTILGKINSIKTRHTLLIADSCFSGSLIRKTRGESNSRFFQDLSRKKSRQIITSGGLEPVDDQGSGSHSIFAGKLISILSENRQDPLSASELAFNLRKEVKNAWGNQTPEYGRLQIQDDENGEFFFVRLVDQAETPVETPVRETRQAIVIPSPVLKTYSYDNLPHGVCLSPKSHTDLRHCKFKGKKLEDINLEGSNLEGVDLRYINLQSVNLKGANLKKTDWRYSTIDELQAAESYAENSDWRYTNISDTDLSRSNLRNTDFRYADLEDVKLDYADLTAADVRYASLEDVSMEGTNLRDVKSNSDELFNFNFHGVIEGLSGPLSKSETKPVDTGPTSQDNRADRFLFFGIKPFSYSIPGQELRPLNIGVYLGNDLLIGAEFGSVAANNATSTTDSKAELTVRGAFVRLFPGGSFNFLFGINRLTWSGESTAYASSGSSQNMTVTEEDVVTIATAALGNQWLLDSGITIGCDWALLSGRLSDNKLTRKVTNNGGTSVEIAKADSELNELEDTLWKDDLFSNRSHYLTLSLGYSF